jgi:hypothetical protein
MAGSIVVRSKNQVRPDQGYEDPEEEDILDYYLKELSYAAQTWYSMRVALSSVWRKLQVAAGAEATKEKLKVRGCSDNYTYVNVQLSNRMAAHHLN